MEKVNIKIPEYYASHKNSVEPIKVATYQRVSTLHAAQVAALDNQIKWMRNQMAVHPNWELVAEYTDMGLSGTKADNRDAFQRMIADASAGKINLIVTREISRFSRNLLDTLQYTRFLRTKGCEVFFANEGIWSWDSDGELRMAMLGILAQDASRHTSDRAKAGQEISHSKGMLYGRGNIMGYNLLITPRGESNRYVIDQEQADTVRMIFDMYLNRDMGYKAICSELIAKQRRNPSGIIKWDANMVGRILSKRVYAGYLVYGQSVCTDFLSHKRKNLPVSEHICVKAPEDIIPPIITDEQWKAAQVKREAHTTVKNGQANRGKPAVKEKWVKKLKCSCGSSYKRFKWRTNEGTGEEVFGYQCANQVNHRKRSYIEAQGIDGEGFCNVKSIARWKLEIQLTKMLKQIWRSPETTISNLVGNIEQNYVEYQERSEDKEVARLEREKERKEQRMKNLLEMRLDGEIDKTGYLTEKESLEKRIDEINTALKGLLGNEPESLGGRENLEDILSQIYHALEETADLEKKFLDEELVDKVVERVIPYEGSLFRWYLNIGSEPAGNFNESDFVKYTEFVIGFDEARAYRKRFGNFMRMCQWNDITTEVYIRV